MAPQTRSLIFLAGALSASLALFAFVSIAIQADAAANAITLAAN